MWWPTWAQFGGGQGEHVPLELFLPLGGKLYFVPPPKAFLFLFNYLLIDIYLDGVGLGRHLEKVARHTILCHPA